MLPYDSCYGGRYCTCVRCRYVGRRRTPNYGYTYTVTTTTTEAVAEAEPLRDALIDIAHDCGTLDAAQRRAKEALKDKPA